MAFPPLRYVGGGGLNPAYSNVWEYLPRMNRWQPGPTLPKALTSGTAVCLGDHTLMVAGGINGGFYPTSEVWRLALPPQGSSKGAAGSSWQPGPPLPAPKGFSAGSPLAPVGFVVVGGTGANVAYGYQESAGRRSELPQQ